VLVTGSRFINNEVTSNQFSRVSDKSGDSLKLENNTFEGSGPRPDTSGQNGNIPSATEPPEPNGKTRRYGCHNLEIELTNVKSDRTETMNDDGGNLSVKRHKFSLGLKKYPGVSKKCVYVRFNVQYNGFIRWCTL
jgi:hypothetical protein